MTATCTCDGTGVVEHRTIGFDLCPCTRTCGQRYQRETCLRTPGHRSPHRETGSTWPNVLPVLASATPTSPHQSGSRPLTSGAMGSAALGDVGIGAAGRSPRPEAYEASQVANADTPLSPSP